MNKVPKPPKKKDNRKNIAKAVFAILVVCFLASSIWAVNIYQELNWPKVNAEVVKTEISDEYGDYKYLYVSYQYNVGKEKYLSKELIGQFKNPKLHEVRDRYKHGSIVDVAYNPSNPKICALSSASNPTILNIVLAILVFLLVLLGVDFWLIKYKLP